MSLFVIVDSKDNGLYATGSDMAKSKAMIERNPQWTNAVVKLRADWKGGRV